MDQRIHIFAVHTAVKLSVPYDLNPVVHAFYTFYSTLPVSGENIWGADYTSQERYMTLDQVFVCLSSFTKDLQDRGAIKDRMVGYVSTYGKIPYEEVEAAAKIHFT
jgi:hypothetical protein